MTEQPEIRLRLSVWRPASLDRTYLHRDVGSRPNRYLLLDESTLLDRVYAWDTGRHDIFGSCDTTAAKTIQDRLLRPFGQHEPPTRRCVRRFRRVLTDILDNPEVRSGTSWYDSPDTVATSSGELNLRANVALGVLRHFRWVAGVYADVPEASVLIR